MANGETIVDEQGPTQESSVLDFIQDNDQGVIEIGLSRRIILGALATTALLAFAHDGSQPKKGSADLEGAHTSASLQVIDITHIGEVCTSDIKFKEVLIANEVSINLPRMIDPEVDYRLDGVGNAKLCTPASAITQSVSSNGEQINVSIDASQTKATLSWDEGQTKVTAKDDNEKDMIDGISNITALADNRFISSDDMAKLLTRIDDAVEARMRQKGLEAFDASCRPQLEPEIRQGITRGFKYVAESLGRGSDNIVVTVTNAPLSLNKPQETFDAELFKVEDEDFKLDENTCTVEAVAGIAPYLTTTNTGTSTRNGDKGL